MRFAWKINPLKANLMLRPCPYRSTTKAENKREIVASKMAGRALLKKLLYIFPFKQQFIYGLTPKIIWFYIINKNISPISIKLLWFVFLKNLVCGLCCCYIQRNNLCAASQRYMQKITRKKIRAKMHVYADYVCCCYI